MISQPEIINLVRRNFEQIVINRLLMSTTHNLCYYMTVFFLIVITQTS